MFTAFKIQKNKKKGFTLIELMLAISIVTMISVLVLESLTKFRDRQLVEIGSENIMSLLAKARTDTLASLDDSEYGVHFEFDRMVLFKGGVFTEPSSDNTEVLFDLRVGLVDISLTGGGADVIFDRLTGGTSQYGVLTFGAFINASTTQKVTIFGTGSTEKY